MTRHLVLTLVTRGLLIFAGFASSIITARYLGPEGRGIFFYWITLAAFAIQFGNLGLHSSNTYYLLKGRARFSMLAANSLWVSVVLGGTLSGLLVIFLWAGSESLEGQWLLLAPVLFLIPSGLYFMLGANLLVADGRIFDYNGFELINRYLGLAATWFTSWYWGTPEALLVATCVISVLICLPLYFRLRALDKNAGPSWKLFLDGLGYGMRAYVVAGIGFAVLRLNVLLLEQLADVETLGAWSIAAQLLDVIVVIPSAAALIWLPRIMRSKDPYDLMHSQLRMMAIVLALVCAVAASLGSDAILFLYGEHFASAYTMLLWGLPGSFALGLTSVLSQYLACVGIPFVLVFIWLTGLVVEFGFAIWLVPSQGGSGAMMSLTAAYLIVLGMVWVLAVNCHAKKMGIENVYDGKN